MSMTRSASVAETGLGGAERIRDSHCIEHPCTSQAGPSLTKIAWDLRPSAALRRQAVLVEEVCPILENALLRGQVRPVRLQPGVGELGSYRNHAAVVPASATSGGGSP